MTPARFVLPTLAHPHDEARRGEAAEHLLYLSDAVNNVVKFWRSRQGRRGLRRCSDVCFSVNGRRENVSKSTNEREGRTHLIVAPSAERVAKRHPMITLQTQSTFVHVVADVTKTVKDGPRGWRLVGAWASMEEAQQRGRRRPRSRVVREAAEPVCSGAALLGPIGVAHTIRTKGEIGMGKCPPAWGRREGMICETCGRCGEDESSRGILFVSSFMDASSTFVRSAVGGHGSALRQAQSRAWDSRWSVFSLERRGSASGPVF